MPTKKATKKEKPVKKAPKTSKKETKPKKTTKTVKKETKSTVNILAKEAKKPAKNEQLKHDLIPEHIKLSDKEKENLMKKFNITMKELPKIFASDPAIRHLGAKEKDVIKIIRTSPTAKNSIFYRGVINE